MIGFVLLTIILRQLLDSGGPTPTPSHRDADVFSYFYLPAEPMAFMISEPFVPAEPVPEPPAPVIEDRVSTFYLPPEESVFMLPPETSTFWVGES